MAKPGSPKQPKRKPKKATLDLGGKRVSLTNRRSDTCGVCLTTYTEPNDLVRFGVYFGPGQKGWAVCGDCTTFLWNERNPDKMKGYAHGDTPDQH